MLRGEPITLNCCWFSMTAPVAQYFAGITVSVKYVWCGSLNLGSDISNKRLNAGSSTTFRDCKPWQMKFAVALTSCLCLTLSLENGVDLASVPLIVSCVDAFTAEALLGLGRSSLSCCWSAQCSWAWHRWRWDFRLKVLPEYATTARQSRQMVFFWSVIVPVSSTGKPKCFQIAFFVMKLGFTIWSNLFTVNISVYTQAEDKLKLTTALSDNR